MLERLTLEKKNEEICSCVSVFVCSRSAVVLFGSTTPSTCVQSSGRELFRSTVCKHHGSRREDLLHDRWIYADNFFNRLFFTNCNLSIDDIAGSCHYRWTRLKLRRYRDIYDHRRSGRCDRSNADREPRARNVRWSTDSDSELFDGQLHHLLHSGRQHTDYILSGVLVRYLCHQLCYH